ncbi:FtsX-like permease family protein [Chitinophaga polysaccharea]|uniref:ABC transporter permease n=1 Tax=Chitinophaga TaxID=79328 RepID=UPI0014553C1B|nr:MULTISPECIES: ABC transporter permease [Chitinophaga]NLR56811.1 FtsX-like permease family protein [Chitinophaga polysaccharea]NLU93034.1 FtsX-like permease family protein [Chitinophaga sp. Ak27]
MFVTYLKTAWRNLLKDRKFASLNLVGLATGLACALLIYIWVMDELSMNKFNQQDAQLYQVLENRVQASGIWTAKSSPMPMADALAKEMPEVAYTTQTTYIDDVVLSTSKELNITSDGKYAGKDFFHLFSYQLIAGNPNQVLADNNAIVLSEATAIKLFGTTQNIVGKTVEFQHEKFYTVSGVFRLPKQHTNDIFDFLLPMTTMKWAQNNKDNWGNTAVHTFALLKPGADVDKLNAKLAGFIKQKTNGDITHRTAFLQRYSDNYLYGRFENGVQVGGRIEYVRLFSIIAIFILLIACINFMNLSTAKAASRAKEVGVKKALGAGRSTLVLQYLGESVLMAFAALLLAILLVYGLLPAFNHITQKQLSLSDLNINFILSAIGITLFTGLVAGSYPAFLLSGFKPVIALKGKFSNSIGELLIRKGLVVFQFTLSIILIVAVLVIYRQISFIQTKNLGYSKDHIISIYKQGKLEDTHTQNTFLAEARNIPGITSATSIGHELSGHSSGTSGVYWPGKDPKDKTEFEYVPVDYDLLQTLNIQIKEGRAFSRSFGADSSAIIFNEAAIKFMGLKDPIGKQVRLWDNDVTIVGVVKDFNFQSLHEKVKPLLLKLEPGGTYRFMMKIETGKEKPVMAALEKLYHQFNPGFPFKYAFLDKNYEKLYAAENQVSLLSRYFAGLAILISCLGLFGLAAFTAQKRNKEIGIRKVLGATVGGIVMLLSKDFLRLILLAILIAVPLAWWATQQWLKGFAYSVHIGPCIFITAGITVIALTFITISFQSIKAALADPAKSLKTE